MEGKTLGHYRLIEVIGAGGMGVVYRARDERLDRDVALKLLSAGTLANEEARKRFRNEAIALSRLNHPNIATVHDFNTEDGLDFLVLEYIPGETLHHRLAGGPLSDKEATRLGAQLALGLAAAHERGVMHLDLKPGNIRVTPDNRLKILDFGLAAFRHPDADPVTTATAAGQMAMGGTLPYMSPEQLRAEGCDPRMDIYGAGAVLYEMVTGRRAFLESGGPQLVTSILQKDPPPPRTINSRLSPALENIILKALDKDPERRYQSAREMAIDLERVSSPSTAPPQARRLPRPARWAAAAIVAALLVGIAAVVPAVRNSIARWSTRSAMPDSKNLAVLPFRAIGGGAENLAYCDGLTETVSMKLAQVAGAHALEVVPASEARARRVTSAEQARKELGATLVLEGTVHQSGGALRINYALVDARTLRQLRAETITVPAGDPFALQDRVVSGMVRMLELELNAPERQALASHGTQVAGAREFYLTGRGYLQYYDKPENIDNAITVFDRALQLDPSYSLAYAGRGEAYWKKYDKTKEIKWAETSQHDCEKALALDARLAAAHVCLGTVCNGRGQYEKGAHEFQRALEDEPMNDDAYRGLAVAQEHLGHYKEAEQSYRRAIELRPHYWAGYSWLGTFYYHRAQYKEAAEQFEQVTALMPDNGQAYYNLVGMYGMLERYEDAIAAGRKSIELRPSLGAYANLGSIFMRLHRFNEAVAVYEQALKLGKQDYRVWGYLGRAYYWAPGKRPQARDAYQEALRLGEERLRINPRDEEAQIRMALHYAMVGRRPDAFRHLKVVMNPPPEDPEFYALAAVIHNQFGEREAALVLAEKAVAKGYTPSQLRTHIELDNLSNEPRFQALLRPKG